MQNREAWLAFIIQYSSGHGLNATQSMTIVAVIPAQS
jgi:hypothetical protein